MKTLAQHLRHAAAQWLRIARSSSSRRREMYYLSTGFAAGASVGAWQIGAEALERARECKAMATRAALASATGGVAADAVSGFFGAFAGEMSEANVVSRLAPSEKILKLV